MNFLNIHARDCKKKSFMTTQNYEVALKGNPIALKNRIFDAIENICESELGTFVSNDTDFDKFDTDRSPVRRHNGSDSG